MKFGGIKMKYSYISHLYCPKCSKQYDANEIHNLCTCGAPLLVNYDLETLAKNRGTTHLKDRKNDLWRYHELLPLNDPDYIVSLGEGMTPLIEMSSLGADMGINNLYMKDEGIIPTGTFKARGA